jgi:hypothetical protein
LTYPVAKALYVADKTRFQPWANIRWQVVVAPQEYDQEGIPLPITRNGKQSSAIVTMAASGKSPNLLVVVARKTYESEFIECGFGSDSCTYIHHESRFMTAEIIRDWAREDFKYAGPACLLMDGYSCDFGDAFTEMSRYGGII